MPRMDRLVLPNYPHHVVQRGYKRQVVFAADEGRGDRKRQIYFLWLMGSRNK